MPGATTLGLVCKDGVVLASERRVSYGYFIMSKTGKKIFKITDRIGAASAGLVGDMQVQVREVVAYLNIYSYEAGKVPSVRNTAKLMSNLLFRRRFSPYLTQTIVGGVDDKGPSIYVLDPLGSVIEDKYASVGSGAEIAVGILESDYRDGLKIDETVNLARKAVKSAVSRDIGSGNGIDVLMITLDGIREEFTPLQ
ncbi:MAG: archaeal proteasome endopeptidase complex subunit beta [Nitrososphaeria archaeon]|nr:archaeal proteasome endopeptidase complex subunit beta [Nitrososphaeria archaeon]NIN51995.1 archaeal proteasome endopeptidase complex subunit beta [Nitrososphaeria archaeon]NIQ32456.1 archaeal proteasome endopeptidase complex subunit beta [Nitrososphaeria archaeon]